MKSGSSFNVVLVWWESASYTIDDVLLISARIKQIHGSRANIYCLNNHYGRRARHKDLVFLPLQGTQPGWWAKMDLFRPDLEWLRPFLFLDLDTMVMGDIGTMLEKVDAKQFVSLTDLYGEKFNNRLQSAVMWIPRNHAKIKKIWSRWDSNREQNIEQYVKRSRGDQTFIEESIGDVDARFQDLAPNTIFSIKPLDKNDRPALRDRCPQGAVLVCLHGKPKMAEAAKQLPWVRTYCMGFHGVEGENGKGGVSLRQRLECRSRDRIDAPHLQLPWISVLLPTRGRAEMTLRAVESIERCTECLADVEVLVYIDSNDPELPKYIQLLDNHHCRIVVGPSSRGKRPEELTCDKVGMAWNEIARMASGEYLMMGNDDLVWATKGWDRILLQRLWRFYDGIFMTWCNDAMNGDKRCCFPIISRQWAEATGEFVPEYFMFLYHDTWLDDVAKLVDEKSGEHRRLYIPEIVVRHDHAGDTRPVDDIHRFNRQGGMHKHDKEIYESREAQHLRKIQARNLKGNWGIERARDQGWEQLQELWKGKRVALVGPSPHLVGKELGKELDRYDCIVRVNELYPFCLELDYGSRTDVACYTMSPGMPDKLRTAIKRMKKEGNGLRMFVSMIDKEPEIEMLSIVSAMLPDTALARLNPIRRQFLKKWVGTCPNTGLLTLAMIASYEPANIFVTGFSFYSEGMGAVNRHHASYVQYGGDLVAGQDTMLGHPQEPQKRWMVDCFLPTYGNMITLDSKAQEVLGLSSLEEMEDIEVSNDPPSPQALECVEKWRGEHALTNQHTGKGDEWPDSDGPDFVRLFCGEGKVCEVGCGTGRVAAVFGHERYIGLDVSPTVLEMARKRLPNHDFRIHDILSPYPPADVYLFHTSLLHMPDDEVRRVARNIPGGRVVIFESMDSSLGNGKINFQRDVGTYERMFTDAGWVRASYCRVPSCIRPGFRDYLVFEKMEEAAK